MANVRTQQWVVASVLVATSGACAHPEVVPPPALDRAGAPQVLLRGRHLGVVERQSGALTLYEVLGGSEPTLKALWRTQQAAGPWALSGDGEWLALAPPMGDHASLRLIHLGTGEETPATPLLNSPRALWVGAGGAALGVLTAGELHVLAVEGGRVNSEPVYRRAAEAFMGSPSGRLVLLTDAQGALTVVQGPHWQELPAVAAALSQGLVSWQTQQGLSPEPGGPFIAPVSLAGLTADDQVLVAYLEGAQGAPSHICLGTGVVLPGPSLGREVTVRYRTSTTGRLFALQVLPGTDEPGAADCDCGLHVYETATGARLASFPWSASERSRYAERGAAGLLDGGAGWFEFLPGDQVLLIADGSTGRLRLQPLLDPSGQPLRPQPLEATCAAGALRRSVPAP